MKKIEIIPLFALFLLIAGILFSGCMTQEGQTQSPQTITTISYSIIKPGDTVNLDLTIPDSSGNTLIESQFIVIANQSRDRMSNFIFSGIHPGTGSISQNYSLFSLEYNAISSGIVGMKLDEEKSIPEPTTGGSFAQNWDPQQLKNNGIDISHSTVGNIILMEVADSPTSMGLRIGTITSITPNGATIDFSYSKFKIKILQIIPS